MIAIILLPVFLAGHGLLVHWLFKWLRSIHTVFKIKLVVGMIMAVYTYLILDMYIAVFIPHGKLEHISVLIGSYWLGITIYAVMLMAVALLIRFILLHSKFKDSWWINDKRVFIVNGILYIIAIAAIMIGGHINAKIIRTVDYEVHIDKPGGNFSELNVVLIADLHMGHNIQADMMEQMVTKVNECNPDVIVIGGDIFDNDYDALQDPEALKAALKKLKSKYGIYAVYGNHDVAETIINGFTFPSKNKKESDLRMDEFVKECNFELLRDESVLIDDSVYIFGRPDEERPGRGVEERMEIGEIMQTMDNDKPIIILEHEPKFLKEIGLAGADLHLAGHTHDGQFFPMNITDDFVFDNCFGEKEFEGMTSIVTAGVGLYGPYIRVCTEPDISNIHITFN